MIKAIVLHSKRPNQGVRSHRKKGLEFARALLEFFIVILQSLGVLLNLLGLSLHLGLARLQLPLDLHQLIVVPLHALADATNPLAQDHVGLRRLRRLHSERGAFDVALVDGACSRGRGPGLRNA